MTDTSKTPRTAREFLGTCTVDSGTIWIGDPCYVMGDDASSRVTDWGDFCDKLFDTPSKYSRRPKINPAPLGKGTGVAVDGFGGDGGYSVWVTKGRDGLITKAEIFFYYSVDSSDPETGKYHITRKQADTIIARYKAQEEKMAAEREEMRQQTKRSLIECGLSEEEAEKYTVEARRREEDEESTN